MIETYQIDHVNQSVQVKYEDTLTGAAHYIVAPYGCDVVKFINDNRGAAVAALQVA